MSAGSRVAWKSSRSVRPVMVSLISLLVRGRGQPNRDLAGWPTRGCFMIPCVGLADDGARQTRTQPVWRGSATRTGEDAVWRDAGAARRAQVIMKEPLKDPARKC